MKGEKIQVVINYLIAIASFIASYEIDDSIGAIIFLVNAILWLSVAIIENSEFAVAKAKEEMQNEVDKLKEEIDRLEKEIKSAHILKGEYWEEYKK